MANKTKAKGKGAKQTKASSRKGERSRALSPKKTVTVQQPERTGGERNGQGKSAVSAQQARRRDALLRLLLGKRQEVMNEIRDNLGHSLTEDQSRRLEGMDTGDQEMMDLDR